MSQAAFDIGRRELAPAETPPVAAAPGYWRAVGQRVLRDPVTIVVTLILCGIVFISLGAPLVAGADPYVGNVLARLKPIGTPGHWLGTDETGRDLWTEKPSLTMPFNLTGFPAMSVCTGFGTGGLPVSIQLITRPFAEATLFQTATRMK